MEVRRHGFGPHPALRLHGRVHHRDALRLRREAHRAQHAVRVLSPEEQEEEEEEEEPRVFDHNHGRRTTREIRDEASETVCVFFTETETTTNPEISSCRLDGSYLNLFTSLNNASIVFDLLYFFDCFIVASFWLPAYECDLTLV